MKNYFYMLSIAGIMCLWACSSKNEISDTETYQVISVIQKDTYFTTEYVGEIYSTQNVEIRTKIDGFIDKVWVDEGDFVREGKVLVTLNRTQYEQELQSAEANLGTVKSELKSAELELTNAESLHRKQILSETELEMARARYEGLQAQVQAVEVSVRKAQLNLSYTNVKAPFDGIINRLPNKKGSLVDHGTFLTSISNTNEVFVYFNVSEREYLDHMYERMRAENNVSLKLANDKVYPYKGKIETLDGEIDQSTGTIAFRARFANPDNLLRHGGSGKIQIVNHLSNVLLVPQKSVVNIQGNLYVFAINDQNEAHIKQFISSRQLSHFYVVASGLSTTDRFIYEGVQRVQNGETIEPEEISVDYLASIQ